MKRFISHTVLFIAASIGIMIGLFLVERSLIKDAIQVAVTDSSSYIILGHSHAEVAYNDDLIEDFTNYASSGESYFYTYLKTSLIFESNPNIKTVFIEFSNNQIHSSMDDWIADNKYLSKFYVDCAPFMSGQEHEVLFKKNTEGYINHSSIALRDNFKRYLVSDYDYYSKLFGGFVALERNKTDSLLEAFDQNGVPDSMVFDKSLSEINLQYLRLLIDLCEEHRKEVVLIRSPQHQQYPGRSNENVFQDILAKRFGNLTFVDLNDLQLENSEFGDLDHLNTEGSNHFSIIFNQVLSEYGVGIETQKRIFNLNGQ